MANPKSKHTRSRRGNRRSHDALSKPAVSTCSQCGEPKRPHNVCHKCGTYKGREVIKTGEEL
ncbi:MAG: 50S ribosomal protein L32 [Deltaproteobacteria bacterium]|nr:50S ribosomal protein L32 [Deltaproteobacteria bacterium]